MKHLTTHFAAALILSLLAWPSMPSARAADYFVSPTGSDTNSGTSQAKPWQTLDRVSAAIFRAGNRVLLQGGHSFQGTLTLHREKSAAASLPIIITSYGAGRATIAAGSGDGLNLSDTGAVTVSNLAVAGQWDAPSQKGSTGTGVMLNSSITGQPISNVRLEHLDVSGFKSAGIALYAYPKDGGVSGFDHTRIIGCRVHDNGSTGIAAFGSGSPAKYPFTHLYIGHCLVYSNRGVTKTGTPKPSGNSGSGILLSDVDGGMVERCIAHNNGDLEGGGCGIWCYDSHAVTFQYNESYDNSTSATNSDGDGFDLDGGVTNSVVQYNYAHGNAGAGILVWEFSKQGGNHDNTIRYNICQSNGTHGWYAEIHVGGNPMSGIHIYNNTLFATPQPGLAHAAISFEKTTASDFRNNLVVTTGGVPLVGANAASFQGNNYWASGGAISLDGASSLADFRLKGQETLAGKPVGLSVDPLLVSPGAGETFGNADDLSRLHAYNLQAGSPMLRAGLPLLALFGENAGAADFFGASALAGDRASIGASQKIWPPPTARRPHSSRSTTRKDFMAQARLSKTLKTAPTSPASSTELTNGDFKQGLSGWATEGGTSAAPVPGFSESNALHLGPDKSAVSQKYVIGGLRLFWYAAKLKADSPAVLGGLRARCYDAAGHLLMDVWQAADPQKAGNPAGADTSVYFKTQADTAFVVVSIEKTSAGPGFLYAAGAYVAAKAADPLTPAPICDLHQYLLPIWKGKTVYNETVLMLSEGGKPASGQLLFTPKQIVSVQDYALSTSYIKGKDYSLDGRTLTVLPGSRMTTAKDTDFPAGDYQWYTLNGKHIVVTYTHDAAWHGLVPAYVGKQMPHTLDTLRQHAPLRIVALGDSITLGDDVSSFLRIPPYMPTWAELFARRLGEVYSDPHIQLYNTAVGGKTASWGDDSADSAVGALHPDLVIVAFGMNDFSSVSPDEFKRSIQGIIHKVRARQPGAEFLLISPMCYDPTYKPDAETLARMAGYTPALRSLTGRGVCLLDMHTLTQVLYAAKKPKDFTENPLHPNDFLARWYAQGLIALLEPPGAEIHKK